MGDSDILRELTERHKRLWVLADSLKEGDRIEVHADMTRLPGDRQRDLAGDVERKAEAGPEGRSGWDLRFTDQNGQRWRLRFVEPGEFPDGQYHHGTASLYIGDHWGSNTGLVLEMDVTPRGPHPIGGYVSIQMDEARCPECGNESGNVRHEREGPVQPVPPDHAGECGECGHQTDPIAFHHAWKWKRMSEDEREHVQRQADRMADRMAEYQHSAHYLSRQREP